MGIDGRREGQYDGYPFVPRNEERPHFARCVRNAIVERVLDGAQAVYRFGDGRRFKFPIPDGDKLLSHVIHADVIAVQGERKSIQVTVRFPCVVPHAPWSSDPFETTIRVEYAPELWGQPKPRDTGIDLGDFRDGEVPARPSRSSATNHENWISCRDEAHGRESLSASKEEGTHSLWRSVYGNRIAIGVTLAASLMIGALAADNIDIPKRIRQVRQQLQKLYDWIDGTQRPITLPPPR